MNTYNQDTTANGGDTRGRGQISRPLKPTWMQRYPADGITADSYSADQAQQVIQKFFSERQATYWSQRHNVHLSDIRKDEKASLDLYTAFWKDSEGNNYRGGESYCTFIDESSIIVSIIPGSSARPKYEGNELVDIILKGEKEQIEFLAAEGNGVPLGTYITQMLDFSDEMYGLTRTGDQDDVMGAFKVMMYVEDIMDSHGRGWVRQQPSGSDGNAEATIATKRMDSLRVKIAALMDTGEFDELIGSVSREFEQWVSRRNRNA